MVQSKKFKDFSGFWPEYLRLHSKPVTRAAHYIGTAGGIALAGAGVALGAPLLIVAGPLAAYGLLFASHPLFEKNNPASFRNPVLSIGGDFKMLFCFLTGKLKGEYEKHGLDYTGKTGNNQNDPIPATRLPPHCSEDCPSPLNDKALRDAFGKKHCCNDNDGSDAPKSHWTVNGPKR